MSKQKSKAEWTTKSLKEISTSEGVVWRSQISTAPDGKRFVGVRKFAVKADGTEVVTRDGITVLLNDGKVPVKQIRAIIELFGVFLPKK